MCQSWTHSQRTSASLSTDHWHPAYTIGCARSDWLRGWLCFFQPGGWQADIKHISPDCCISQSVRPQLLASVRLDEHHRNNKKDPGMSIITQNAPPTTLSQFGWQPCFHLESGIIRGFCLLSDAEAEDRRGCMGEKNPNMILWFLWEMGKSLWCCSFMEAYNILWYFISHPCLKNPKKKHVTTNICTHTLFWFTTQLKDVQRFCLQIFVLQAAQFLKVPIFRRTGEWMSVLFDFLRKMNQCLDEHKS